jgi:E3 ubiquitin-protein ligase TRIP12
MLDGVFDHKGYTEKSLARLVKAKAKADRAAARLAAHQAHVAQTSSLLVEPSFVVMVPLSSTIDREASPAPGTDVPSHEADEAGDHMVVEAAAESEVVPDRMEMLRSKSAVVAKFMQLLVPILIDVYAASVITPVRIKTLTGLLKAVSFLDGDGLKRVLMVSLGNQHTYSVF